MPVQGNHDVFGYGDSLDDSCQQTCNALDEFYDTLVGKDDVGEAKGTRVDRVRAEREYGEAYEAHAAGYAFRTRVRVFHPYDGPLLEYSGHGVGDDAKIIELVFDGWKHYDAAVRKMTEV